jgi:hypothetical protein
VTFGRAASLALCSVWMAVSPSGYAKAPHAGWTFMVSGDSRNCGDVVMPAIAAAASAEQAAFYWHLGDLRLIADVDDDYRSLHPTTSLNEYLAGAWADFKSSQIEAFGATPFFLGIGNHETVAPKGREEFVSTFAPWLDTPIIREQRLQDDPEDNGVRPYYHWRRDGIEFISLDNATPDEFDAAQLKWLSAVLQRARHDASVRALVVGMHEALPESLARGHSMSDFSAAEASGLNVYTRLLEVRRTKPVYVLASHSHFVMSGIFNTPYWHEHGGVLPGWIVGTAGAYRYALPPGSSQATFAKTHVYGYLRASVAPREAKAKDPIRFEFKELQEDDTPRDVAAKYGTEFVHHCYAENAQGFQ